MSATNRGAVRNDFDFYETPKPLTQVYLPTLEHCLKEIGAWKNPVVYEPAAGKLAIVDVICQAWPHADVQYSDINPAYAEYGGIDFLTATPEPIFDLIITNPPYVHAQAFIERAKLWLRTPNSIIAMMLRVGFVGSKHRAEWWRSNIPSLSFTPARPKMKLNQDGKLGSDASEYAWFRWPQTAPVVEWLPTENMDLSIDIDV